MRNCLLMLSSLMTAVVPIASAAIIYTDPGGTGQTIATARSVNSMPGGTQLDEIVGSLPAGVAQIYKIYLSGGQTFSATTTNNTFFDSELFLFDVNGLGVYANDDDPNSPPQSTLPASISLTPSTAGIYYLAIAGVSYLPVSSVGQIFPSTAGILDPDTGTLGPTGPGGGNPLTGWTSTSSENGGFQIDLTGAQFLPSTAAVPEPSSMLLLGIGTCAMVLARRYFVR